MPRVNSTSAMVSADTAKTGNGTLTLTGANQLFIPANFARIGLFLSNNSAANPMWVALGPTAAANQGIRLSPGQTLPVPGYTGQVAVFGTAADVLSFVEI